MCPDETVSAGGTPAGKRRLLPYMLRRYCPPTSYKALEICPSEQQRTASIITAKTFWWTITACFGLQQAGHEVAAPFLSILAEPGHVSVRWWQCSF